MKSFTRTVLLTTLLAGTLDIVSAFLSHYFKTGEFATKMFQYIAGGALGLKTSLPGGAGVIALGVFFHYFIAFLFTLFYFLIYQKARLAAVNKYVAGLVYGIFVWVVMNLLVLPLSMLPSSPIKWPGFLVGMSILMVMIGLPIAIRAHNYYKKQPGITVS